MSKPQITETASRRPGRCAISKNTQGPFLDTGENIPGFGHVYLSMRFLEPLLRDQGGFVPATDVEDLEKENQELRNENDELQAKAEHLDELIEAVRPHLPKPEPELVPRTITKERAPTDEEIEKWIAENGADHRVVRAARRAERGSTRQWRELYDGTKVTQPPTARQATPSEAELSPAARARIDREDDEDRSGAAPQNVELYDQTVDLDVVLNLNVSEVNEYIAGKPQTFIRALVEREFHLRELEDESPRKGILEPLGYWDEDKNEPLHPRVVDKIEHQESEEDAGDETIPDNLTEPGETKKAVAARPETAGDVEIVEEGETPEAGRASEEVEETPTEAEEDSEDSEEEDEEEVDLSDLDEEDETDPDTYDEATDPIPEAEEEEDYREDFTYDDEDEE